MATFLRWGWLVPFLLGGGLRFHHAWSCYDVYLPHIDQEEGYYESGISLSAHHVLGLIPESAPSAFRSPFYPTFIAVIEGFFDHPSPGHVRMAQAALSTLGILVVFVLGRRVLSPLAGFLGSIWMATDVEQILSVSSLNVHGFYSFCILSVALAVLFWMRRRSRRSTVLLAFALAASFLCRSAHFPLPFLLCAAALFWWRFPERLGPRLALLAAATTLFFSPIIVRNALQFKSFILPDSHKGSYIILRGTAVSDFNTTVEQALETAESIEPGFKRLGLSGESLHEALLRLAVRNIRRHPLRYAGLCLERLIFFWQGLWLPVVLGLTALILNPKNNGLQALFLVAASFCGYAVAGGAPEYRVSIAPILCVLGGCGLATLIRRFRPRAMAEAIDQGSRVPMSLAAAAALGLMGLLYAWMLLYLYLELRVPRVPRGPDARVMEVLRLAAVNGKADSASARVYASALLRQAAPFSAPDGNAKVEKALRESGRILRAARDGSAWSSDRGAYAEMKAIRWWIRMRQGDRSGASRELEEALAADAQRACELTFEGLDRGRLHISYYDLCVRRVPEDPGLRVDRGVALFLEGRRAEAIIDFKKALSMRPDNLEAALSLATALEAAGRQREAVAALRGVLAKASARKGEAIYGKAEVLRDDLFYRMAPGEEP